MKVVLAVVACALGASPARADDSYHLQVIAVDAGATAIAASTILVIDHDTVAPVVFITGVAACELGGPITHALHDHWGRAGISLGTHLALPAIGGVIGASSSNQHMHRAFFDTLEGVVVGHVLASVVDVALAYGTNDSLAPRVVSFGGRF